MKRSKWRARLSGSPNDPLLRSWLTEPGSLTARCQRGCTRFRVRLLRYGKGRALADEAAGSTIGRQPAWVREVVLECDGQPVIFAHTTLSTVGRGRLNRWLARLGSRSLGSLLFAYPGFCRGAIECTRLDRRDPLYRAALAALPPGSTLPPQLWARRSTHALGGQQVSVCEVFLPAIQALAG